RPFARLQLQRAGRFAAPQVGQVRQGQGGGETGDEQGECGGEGEPRAQGTDHRGVLERAETSVRNKPARCGEGKARSRPRSRGAAFATTWETMTASYFQETPARGPWSGQEPESEARRPDREPVFNAPWPAI